MSDTGFGVILFLILIHMNSILSRWTLQKYLIFVNKRHLLIYTFLMIAHLGLDNSPLWTQIVPSLDIKVSQ